MSIVIIEDTIRIVRNTSSIDNICCFFLGWNLLSNGYKYSADTVSVDFEDLEINQSTNCACTKDGMNRKQWPGILSTEQIEIAFGTYFVA